MAMTSKGDRVVAFPKDRKAKPRKPRPAIIANIEAERNFLGALLSFNGMDEWAERFVDELRPEDFFDEHHKVIFAAMQTLHAEDKPAGDATLLVEQLRKAGQLKDAGGQAGVSALSTNITTAHNIDRYARATLEVSIERQTQQITADGVSFDLSPSEIVERLQALMERLAAFERLLAGEGNEPYMSAADFMAKALPEPIWIAAGLIPAGLTIISGKPKMGKSWLVLALALARASGGKFLGRDLEQGDVLYLALEDGERALQDRIRKLSLGDAIPARLQIATSKDTDKWHLSLGGLNEMRRWFETHPGGLIIIDTWARVKPRPKNGATAGYQDDYDAAKLVKDLADEMGGAVILITHNRKASAEDPFDEINATMGLAGAFDTGITLRRQRGEADATLHMDSRLGGGCELALAFDKEHCLWRLMGDADEYAMTKERREVYVVLQKMGQAAPKDIAAALDIKPNAVYARLFDMEAAGQVKKLDRGLYTISKDGKDGKYGKDGMDGADGRGKQENKPNLTDLTDLTYLTDLTNLTDDDDDVRERESIRSNVYRWGKTHGWSRLHRGDVTVIEAGLSHWEAWLRQSSHDDIAALWQLLQRA